MLWGHVPTPLAPQESSLFIIVENLCLEHRANMGRSAVVVSNNRDISLRDADLVPVDFTRYCPREWFTRREMYADHLAGITGHTRPHSARLFLPAIEALKEIRPEVVLLHEGHHATPSLPLWRSVWPEARIVLYAHIPFSRGYRRRELRRLLSLADGLIFVSEHSERAATARLGRLPVPSAVVHYGIDAQRFHSRGREQEDTFRITFAGELAPHKGPDLLLAALEHVPRLTDRPLLLRMVGGTRPIKGVDIVEYQRSLRRAVAKIEGTVEWLSRVPHESMPEIYRASDVVCVPSLVDEAFGMVVLEALACGAAVVASGKGGLREAGGEAARYVDPLDEQGFAQAIADLANDSDLFRAVQSQGLAHAAKHTWANSYRRVDQAIRLFLGAGASDGPRT